MSEDTDLLICGASTRAAAFSAMRAGFYPWCIDLFGDQDLRAHCQVKVIAKKDYPRKLPEFAREFAPQGCPWMYTGGLENHAEIVAEISRDRPLIGNGPEVLRRVRDPFLLADILERAGLRFPDTRRDGDGLPTDGSWLTKPYKSAGGRGIRRWHGEQLSNRMYYQLAIKGEPFSATYRVDDGQVSLLGVMKQLIGETFLHAAPFAYCGSILSPMTELGAFARLGEVLVDAFGLQSVFGVDCIVAGSELYVIEVNPRYTASMELLECMKRPAILGEKRWSVTNSRDPLSIGKAVFYAREAVTITSDLPWAMCLKPRPSLTLDPLYVDIPATGTEIRTGEPIVSFFEYYCETVAGCLEVLKERAEILDLLLFAR